MASGRLVQRRGPWAAGLNSMVGPTSSLQITMVPRNAFSNKHLTEVHKRLGESFTSRRLSPDQGSRPNTATLLVLAANTFPSATVTVMNLLGAPNWSRDPAA